MPTDIPKYALRPHSFERLATFLRTTCTSRSTHCGARRAPALLYVVCSVPRFIARTVLDETRLVFRRCLASEANIRKNSLTTPESAVCTSRRPTRLLTPKGYLQELITHAPNLFGERWFWFPDDDTYGVVAYGFGAPSPPATHQRYRCSPTGELLPDPTLPPITLDAHHRHEQAHVWESSRKSNAPPSFEQGRPNNGAGDAEAKTIRVTNGIVANWSLLLDDPNAEQLAPQGANPSLFQYMPMTTDRSGPGQNLAEADIHDKY